MKEKLCGSDLHNFLEMKSNGQIKLSEKNLSTWNLNLLYFETIQQAFTTWFYAALLNLCTSKQTPHFTKFMMKVFSFDFQSLTTLKNVPSSDFGFLRHLSNIEELEIGDCSDWDNEVRTSLLV